MKTEHIQKQLDFFVRDKSHHAYRKPAEDPHALAAQFAAQGLDDMQRSVGRLRYVLAQETPVVFPDERITLLRTVRTIPEIHTEEEDRKLHETHAFHENGRVFNMCPDYGMLMADGFTKKAEKIRAQLEAAQTPEQKEFLQAMLDVLDLVTAFAARYREEAVSLKVEQQKRRYCRTKRFRTIRSRSVPRRERLHLHEKSNRGFGISQIISIFTSRQAPRRRQQRTDNPKHEPFKEMTDTELAQEIRQDNHLAFAMAYDKYHRQLYAFAYRYTRTGSAAEDIVQQAFLKLWENRSRLDPQSGLGGYLFTISRNLTLNVLRSGIPTDGAWERMTERNSAGFLNELERRDLLDKLDQAIGRLSPQKIAVCRMKLHEGLSNAEIAERLHISVNTVKVLYHQSIQQLRKMIGAGCLLLLLLLEN